MDTGAMPPDALISERLSESIAIKQAILSDERLMRQSGTAAATFRDAIEAGRKVVFFGNGGSAGDAAHMAAELIGRFLMNRRAIAALSLTDNMSALTAISNDFGYEHIFARQIEALGAAGDVAVALSTSGRSPNVSAGLRAATGIGMRTVAFTGSDGGDCKDAAELCIRVPSADTARVQEATVALLHGICEWVEAICSRP